MDFISTKLVTMSQPSGFWVTILNAFKNGTGSYILAVILIAIIVRVVFSLVDIINKKVNMKNMEINAKMRPELEAVQKKYGYDQRLLQQKTSEIYKKYQFSMMTSCLPMLIMLVLNFTVFLTLWNSLQKVANFNIAEKYENLKSLYANVIALNENDQALTAFENENFAEGDKLVVELGKDENGKKALKLFKKTADEQTEFLTVLYDETITQTKGETAEETGNRKVFDLLEKYVIEKPADDENPEEVPQEKNGFENLIKDAAERAVEDYYIETQEGFLWIKNVYRSESPSNPLFTKKEVKNYMSGYYNKVEKAQEKEFDYEGQIFECVVAGIDKKQLGVNGYYILTIIAVASSVLSIWVSNRMMRKKDAPPQKQSLTMYFIIPVIFGIFTFMYTSLFAIYLIVGQLVNIALTPLTTLIVKKWNNHSEKKNKDKNVIEVDYRRKG